MQENINLREILKEVQSPLGQLEENASKDANAKYQEQKEKTELERLKEEVMSLKQDRLQRKWLAERIFGFVAFYMLGVFFIILLVGCPNRFYLSDDVLNILLGTTTANVIGVLVIVAMYFFKKGKKQ